MTYTALILIFMALILGGAGFSILAYIPAIRQHAWSSSATRRWLIFALSLMVFAIFYMAFTYLSAKAANTFVEGTYPNGYFGSNDALDHQLEFELWLHLLFPPDMLSPTVCFSGDVMICSAAEHILLARPSPDVPFAYAVIASLIPALSCALGVLNITRVQTRKKR